MPKFIKKYEERYLKIEFDKEWVHLRKSNTESIIRIYSESDTLATADHLAGKIINDIREVLAETRWTKGHCVWAINPHSNLIR